MARFCGAGGGQETNMRLVTGGLPTRDRGLITGAHNAPGIKGFAVLYCSENKQGIICCY